MSTFVSFHRMKPQPTHTSEELARVQRVPSGITSMNAKSVWNQKYLDPDPPPTMIFDPATFLDGASS